MKNANELVNSLSKHYESVDNHSFNLDEIKAAANLAGKIIAVVARQLEYNSIILKTPEIARIPFLETPEKGHENN